MYYTAYPFSYLYHNDAYTYYHHARQPSYWTLPQESVLTSSTIPWTSQAQLEYARRLTYWRPPVGTGGNHRLKPWAPSLEESTDQVDSHGSSKRSSKESNLQLKDYGKTPFVINIEKAAVQNRTFRTAIWTGEHLQVTLMSIPAGESIGLEVHPDTDQFLRIEEGQGVVQMGDAEDRLNFEKNVHDNDAIMVPAGKWHNLTNTGNSPLKLYSIYAPPEHPYGTVHRTKAEAMAAEGQRV